MGGGSPAVVSYGNGTMSAPVVGNYDFYIDHDGNPILNDTITITHWVGFVIQALSTVAFMYLSKNAHDTRIYHYITAGCSGIASCAYMMMALQQGGIIVHHGTVVILWIRSVDYLLATPMLLLDLGLLAGAAADDLFLIITCDIVMIATGYWASVATNVAAKWCLFFFSMVVFCPILVTLLVSLQSNKELVNNPRAARLYNFLVAWVAVLWNGFWVVWVLFEGYHLISMTAEVIVHCILDIFAKCIFGFVLLISHDEIEDALSEAGPGGHEPGAVMNKKDDANDDARSEVSGKSLLDTFSRKKKPGGGSVKHDRRGSLGEMQVTFDRSGAAPNPQANAAPAPAAFMAAPAPAPAAAAPAPAPTPLDAVFQRPAQPAPAPAPAALPYAAALPAALPPLSFAAAVPAPAPAPAPAALPFAAALPAASPLNQVFPGPPQRSAAGAGLAAPQPLPRTAPPSPTPSPTPATPLSPAASSSGGGSYAAMLAAYQASPPPGAQAAALLAAAAAGDAAQVAALLRAAPALARSATDAATGRTALHEAAAAGAAGAAEALVAGGADLRAADARGATPLMLAAGAGRSAQLVGWLADRGAALDALDANLMTPLHHAVLGARAENCAELVARGASKTARDAFGNTPHDLARKQADGAVDGSAQVLQALSAAPSARSSQWANARQ